MKTADVIAAFAATLSGLPVPTHQQGTNLLLSHEEKRGWMIARSDFVQLAYDKASEQEKLTTEIEKHDAVMQRVEANIDARRDAPIPMILYCPGHLEDTSVCGARHIDEGEFATKVHHTHACQFCGHVWRPAVVATVGVRFLPGFKNTETK